MARGAPKAQFSRVVKILANGLIVLANLIFLMLTKIALTYATLAIRHRSRYPCHSCFVLLSTARPLNCKQYMNVPSISSLVDRVETNRVSAQCATSQLGNRTLRRLSSSDIQDADRLQVWDQVLPYKEGSHNAVNIHIPERSESEVDGDDPFSPYTFRSRLDATVETARSMGKSSIWVHVPMSRASLIEFMTCDDPESNLKFQFHRAEGNMASLFLWLKETNCKIPTFATHQLVRIHTVYS